MPNRNTEINTSSLPEIYVNRSRHHYFKNIKTSGNVGDLILFYNNELVQPGDTFNIIMSFVSRLNTPYQPVMDNAYYDIYSFAVEWLDIWNYTKEFWGENTLGAWVQTTEYEVPKITVPAETALNKHSLLAYMGFRQKTLANKYTMAGQLTVLAYCFSYNEYFRDQNYIAPLDIKSKFDGATLTYDENDVTTGGLVCKVAKMHDRFTSGVPEPISNQIGIPLGTSAPIYGDGKSLMIMANGDTNNTVKSAGYWASSTYGFRSVGTNNTQYSLPNASLSANDYSSGYAIGVVSKDQAIDKNVTSGMYADLAEAISATLNAQRMSVGLNHIEEKLGMYGRRLREIYKSCWGVDSNDTAQHIPEYLGGKRVSLNMREVLDTAGGSGELGATGAQSMTADIFELCNKSFTEHSVLIGVMCLRTEEHNGSQGMERQYFKSRKYDYYWPELAGLGFQPVYNGELLFTATNADREAHHFLPSWDEYRREPDRMTGEFSPDNANWLGQWTYANKIVDDIVPAMSQEWLEQSPVNMNRTLIDDSTLSDNYIVDIQLEITKYSVVKQYGIPGMDKF